ncbi:MAG: HEAT repeat domain-containing protein [Thermoanaerobaculia bacterium]|nr:HEAT repeat domain-containing protein [Thermoanaerobaculia bacterium]
MMWVTAVGACVAMAAEARIQYARSVWSRISGRLGLSLDTPKLLPPRLRGQCRDFEVVVFQSKSGVSIEIREVGRWFTLGRDSAKARSVKPDIETGDLEFDEFVRVEGDRGFALGLLDHETRRAAKRVVAKYGGSVANGSILASAHHIRAVPKIIDPMLDLAERLRQPIQLDLAACLAMNALDDPSPGFRLQAFRQLVGSFPEAEQVQPTARHLLREAHDELRLEAARWLIQKSDPENRKLAAEALAELAVQSDLETWIRRLALDHLVLSDMSEIAKRVSWSLLERRDLPRELSMSVKAALEETGALRNTIGLDSSASALARINYPEAQSRLLAALADSDHDGDRLRLAEALGEVGDVRAIPALREAALRLDPPELGSKMEDAIEKIKRRAGGSQAGEVSLHAPAPLEGAVSSADDSPGGEISLTRDSE